MDICFQYPLLQPLAYVPVGGAGAPTTNSGKTVATTTTKTDSHASDSRDPSILASRSADATEAPTSEAAAADKASASKAPLRSSKEAGSSGKNNPKKKKAFAPRLVPWEENDSVIKITLFGDNPFTTTSASENPLGVTKILIKDLVPSAELRKRWFGAASSSSSSSSSSAAATATAEDSNAVASSTKPAAGSKKLKKVVGSQPEVAKWYDISPPPRNKKVTCRALYCLGSIYRHLSKAIYQLQHT